jgi:hypothetical protein
VTLRSRLSAITPTPVRRAVKLGVRATYTLPTNRFRLLPDFLIIGAQRAGTTSLYKYLAQHPAVGPVVLTKGAHYFDTNFDKGLGWYRAHFPTRWRAATVQRRLGVPMQTGEGSPYYAFHPLVPRRVAQTLPDVKLILMVRDPVERAYSQYQHELARGFEEVSFEEAIDLEPGRLAGERERMIEDPSYNSFHHQHHSYLARGRYMEQIRAWLEHVDGGRLLIVGMEEFFSEPERGFGEVLRFLGLPAWRPASFERYNARRYAQLDPAIRQRLIDHFREPNAELERYLGVPLGWSA